MNKIKIITRYLTTYNRTNTYDDTIVESKRLLSYMEFDENGNLLYDKSFNVDGECENIIRRVYNDENLLTEEYFYDGTEDNPYESRFYAYNEKAQAVICKVRYYDDEVEEHFIYDDNNKLLEKKVVYADGSWCVENKYVWKNDLLVDEVDYDDEDTICQRKKYFYDDQDRLINLELHEINQNNKMSENYEYNEFGIVKQTTCNYKGDVLTTRTFVYDKQGLVVERVIETQSQYFKYTFAYNEDKLPVTENMLNREDVVLTKREIIYNEDKEEISAKVYSLNIVENNDEYILIESYSTEIAYK